MSAEDKGRKGRKRRKEKIVSAVVFVICMVVLAKVIPDIQSKWNVIPMEQMGTEIIFAGFLVLIAIASAVAFCFGITNGDYPHN